MKSCSMQQFAFSFMIIIINNIELSNEQGEVGLDTPPFDLVNSPIKEASGWANAPEGALEFTIITSGGLTRRPALILKNEQG